MPTFLRSLLARTFSINSIHAFAQARLTHHNRRACVVSLLLFALSTGISAQAAASRRGSFSLPTPAAFSSNALDGKRLVTLRRNELPEGSRLTITSDSPLTDYKSFAEGERVCIMIPQAAFVSARRDESGRGFADMRIDERDESVKLSFRLQPGATVVFKQKFNRLDVVFMTNERANSGKSS